MFPPALPPSHSHSRHRPFGALGWGRVGASAGLVLGMITPPSNHPFPGCLFFRGGARGRGVKGGLAMPRSSPLPPPPLHPGATRAPGAARLAPVGRRGKRQVRGANAHPTTHKLNLRNPHYQRRRNVDKNIFWEVEWKGGSAGGFEKEVGLGGRKNPRIIVGENCCHFGTSYINAPTPPVLLAGVHHTKWAEIQQAARVGEGAWGFSRSAPQLYPPPARTERFLAKKLVIFGRFALRFKR